MVLVENAEYINGGLFLLASRLLKQGIDRQEKK